MDEPARSDASGNLLVAGSFVTAGARASAYIARRLLNNSGMGLLFNPPRRFSTSPVRGHVRRNRSDSVLRRSES
jgi:hypothetical protein